MRKIVYNFLDEYLGKEVSYRFDNKFKYHYLYSKKNETLILFFRVRPNNKINIYKGDYLSNLVSGLFSLTDKDATRLIRDWFGDTFNLEKVSDLLKFIPNKSYEVQNPY